MISKIEQALINRLQQGLGKMVYSVSGYAGEINDEQLDIRRLPACLVSYGGSVFDTKSMGIRGKRYQTTDVFVVLVITRSMRNATAGRLGGVLSHEIGVNQLLSSVKTLLINQTLDGLVLPIEPKRIRTIWNNAEVKKEKLSAYAFEFEISYNERDLLDDGRYPEGIVRDEQKFKQYQGKLDEPLGDLSGFHNRIFDPNNNAESAFTTQFKEGD